MVCQPFLFIFLTRSSVDRRRRSLHLDTEVLSQCEILDVTIAFSHASRASTHSLVSELEFVDDGLENAYVHT